MKDIRQQVRQFISENLYMGSSGSDFADEASFLEKHIIDSTGFLELVTFLEEQFTLRVEDNEMIPENLDSICNIEAYVNKKLGT